MAVIQQQNPQQQDEQKEQQQNPVQVSSGGSVAPTLNTMPSTPTAPKPSVQGGGTSGRVQNLQKYIQANKNVNYGQQLTGAVQQKVGQLGQQVNQAKQTLQQRASGDLARVRGRENILQQAIADPTKFVQDKTQFEDFSKLRTGDIGTYNVQNLQDLFNQQQKVADFGNLAKSEQGRLQLFRNVYGSPSYSRGQASLDALLLRGGQLRDTIKGTQEAVGQAGQTIQNLQADEQALNKELVEGRKAAQEAIQAGLLGEQGAIPTFTKGLEERTKQLRGEFTGKQQTLADKLSKGLELNADDIKELEFSTPDEQRQFFSFYDRSRAGVKVDPLTGQVTGGPDLDFGQFLERTDPISGITERNVATADEYAKYQALRRLAGQEATLLTDPSQAGTALTDLGKLNTQNALIAALSKYAPKEYGAYQSEQQALSSKQQALKDTFDMLRTFANLSNPAGAALVADEKLLGGKVASTPFIGAALDQQNKATNLPLTAVNVGETVLSTEGNLADKSKAGIDTYLASQADPAKAMSQEVSDYVGGGPLGDAVVGTDQILNAPLRSSVTGVATGAKSAIDQAEQASESGQQLYGGIKDGSSKDIIEGSAGLVTAPFVAPAQVALDTFGATSSGLVDETFGGLSKATGIKEIDDLRADIVKQLQTNPAVASKMLEQMQAGDFEGALQTEIDAQKEALYSGLSTVQKQTGVDLGKYLNPLEAQNSAVTKAIKGVDLSSAERDIVKQLNPDLLPKEVQNSVRSAQASVQRVEDSIRNAARRVSGGGGGGGCFLADTPVLMADGSFKMVQDIRLGDEVMLGGKVFARGEMLADDVYEYRGALVAGTHAAYEDGKWLRIADSGIAKKLDISEVVVYPIATENFLMVVEGYIYADYAETAQGTKVTDDQRIDFMNSQEDVNNFLKEWLNVNRGVSTR